MTRACDVCGAPFVAQRSTARYCGATCRQRSRRGARVTRLRLPREGGVAGAVHAELVDAGMLDHWRGQLALLLARMLEDMPPTMGSAIASLSKELRATLTEAQTAAPRKPDTLDEIRARVRAIRDDPGAS